MTVTRTLLNTTAARSLLGRVKDKPLTYEAVGMSLGRVPAPDGFREYSASKVIGTGEEAYRNAGYALMHWNVHRGAALAVQPDFNVVRAGDPVAVAAKAAPFMSVAGACRVTEVIATGRSTGFAYGTLPGHPECGEESFIITHRDDDQVEFAIRAFSRPGVWYVRLSGPIGRSIQSRVGRRLLESATRYAAVDPLAQERVSN